MKYGAITGIFLAAMLAVGCAAQALKSHIGRDIEQVMLEAGPANNTIDLADGKRAFQWMQSKSTGYATGSGGYAYGGGRTKRCTYTLIADWNESRSAWIVSDYRAPGLECDTPNPL